MNDDEQQFVMLRRIRERLLQLNQFRHTQILPIRHLPCLRSNGISVVHIILIVSKEAAQPGIVSSFKLRVARKTAVSQKMATWNLKLRT
jgi:hypothetical protein